MSMEHDGHRERMRSRYRKEGLNGFAPHEILELLLTYAIPRVNTNPIAHSLIRHFGSLSAVLEARPEELEQVPGVGPQASTLISMLLPTLRRYEQEKAEAGKEIKSYDQLAAYCASLFKGLMHEELYVLCFDAKLKLLATERISTGTPDEVHVINRLIVQSLIRHNATAAVLAHNHPSGHCMPSQEDTELTDQMSRLLTGMNIRLIDHVVVAAGQTYSFHMDRAQPLCRDAFIAFEEEDERSRMAADRPQQLL